MILKKANYVSFQREIKPTMRILGNSTFDSKARINPVRSSCEKLLSSRIDSEEKETDRGGVEGLTTTATISAYLSYMRT